MKWQKFFKTCYKTLVVFLLLPFFLSLFAADIPIEGSALSFQAVLVNDKGVPYGAETAESFYMIFKITSKENGGTELWSSRPRLVQIENGIFSVRIGKFYEAELPLDEYILTGNDDDQRKRFLHVAITTEGSNGPYICFYRRDINPEFSISNVDSHIPISGVPFVVSAIRVIGDDIKEGSLRISKDSLEHEYKSTFDADLKLVATGNFDGLQIIQNRNIGMIIYNKPPASGKNPDDALVTKGAGLIQGTLFLRGERSNLFVDGSLSSVHKDHGLLEVNLNDPIRPAIQAGPLRSPVFKNPAGADFFVSTTGISSLYKLLIMDVDQANDSPIPQLMTVESPYGPNVIRLTDDANAVLTKGGFIELSGTTEKEIYLSSDSAGITALGFYDNRQPRIDSEFPYQLVPHGLSVLNNFKMGGSLSFTYSDAYRLIGEYQIDTMDWATPKTEQSNSKFHKHDLRIAADPDALVQRINMARESRIVKNRIDDYLAYISTDNTYTGRNYMLGYGTHSAFTDNKIITNFGTDNMNVFLGGDEPSPGLRRILLGISTSKLGQFAFLKCPTLRIPETGEFFYDCSDPDPDMLEIEGDFLSVERSLKISNSLEVKGEIKLVEPSSLTKNNQSKFNFRHEGVYIRAQNRSLFAIDYTRLQMSINSNHENRDLFMIVTGELGSNTISIISMR
ncbi:MAG: hypothetical protein PHS19_04990, partial [Eubacteriales bacterium]|nr:hypothetical protein [Eubacteriales bacterium]